MERRRTSVFVLVLVLAAGTVGLVYHERRESHGPAPQPPAQLMAASPAEATPVTARARRRDEVTIPLDILVYYTLRQDDVDLPRIIRSVADVMKKQPPAPTTDPAATPDPDELDVACTVKFVVRSIAKFHNGFDGFVDSQIEFNSIFPPANQDTDGKQVRVVLGFNWCQDGVGNIAGCSDQPGTRVAVRPISPMREGPLWAHEVGHTQNLPHRGTGGEVMFDKIAQDSKLLNATECGKYKGQQP